MKDVLVSIITVCYNSGSTIERTIRSVLTQTYKNIEYILIDGFSQDNTVNIIRKYYDDVNDPSRMRFISEPDDGIYDAMNKGIHMANGQLIGIINSDDWYENDAVENMVKAYIAQSDRDNTLFYGMLRIWRGDLEFCVRRYHHNFITETVIQHPTNFVPKHVYDKFGVFDSTYKISADFELLNRFRINKVSFCVVDKIIANFSKGGASDNLTKEQLLEVPCIKLKYNIISKEQYMSIWNSVYYKPNFFRRLKRAFKYVLFG